jgi:hypothetical protein
MHSRSSFERYEIRNRACEGLGVVLAEEDGVREGGYLEGVEVVCGVDICWVGGVSRYAEFVVEGYGYLSSAADVVGVEVV